MATLQAEHREKHILFLEAHIKDIRDAYSVAYDHLKGQQGRHVALTALNTALSLAQVQLGEMLNLREAGSTL